MIGVMLIHMLQWGRAFSGTEMFKSPAHYKVESWLQWGRAFSGTEISWPMLDIMRVVWGFNGAVPFQARKYQVI